MKNEMWREILELLPPLIFLFLIIFSPPLMRLIQKKILLHEARARKKNQKVQKKEPLTEDELLLSEEKQTGRTVTDSPEMGYSGTGLKTGGIKTPPLEKIESLPPLQKAVIWADILGPPGGIGFRKK